MKRFFVVLVALSLVVLATQPAWAQRGRGGGFGGRGGFGLLAQKSVQDELKLSEDQVKQVTEQMEKQRESLANSQDLGREERQAKFAERQKANQEMLGKVLNPDQLKRFKQIDLQQRGAQAMTDPEVATALGLTAEQAQQVASIQEALRGEMREAFQAGGGGGDREEARKKLEALQNTTNDKLKALLSPEQQTKWKELTGEPFKGEIRRPQGRGGNRPAGAQRGAGANRNPQAVRGQPLFRLASFSTAADDDDQARGAKRDAPRHDARHRTSAARPGGDAARARGGPNAEIWSRVAAAVDDGPRRHGRAHGWSHGPAKPQAHGSRHHPDFARGLADRRGPHGHGPAPAWHGGRHHAPGFAWAQRPMDRGWQRGFGRQGGFDGRSASMARGFAHHHGPPPPMAHHRGHGPAHFALDRGPHGHGNHFASWHRHHGRGPDQLDRHPPQRHDQRPPPPDGRRGDLGAPDGQEPVDRLAQLERSLDSLARQLESLRHELRR